MNKDEAAALLIEWHFHIEPHLREVFRILSDNENADGEPIKLLAINEATIPTGSIEPFMFAGTEEVPFTTVIAEITPDELAVFRDDPRAFPVGWSLARSMRFQRSNLNKQRLNA